MAQYSTIQYMSCYASSPKYHSSKRTRRPDPEQFPLPGQSASGDGQPANNAPITFPSRFASNPPLM
ncbi:hypothetical protein DL98DRAFT_510145, partial [Cadophora sp. DSE1049]